MLERRINKVRMLMFVPMPGGESTVIKGMAQVKCTLSVNEAKTE